MLRRVSRESHPAPKTLASIAIALLAIGASPAGHAGEPLGQVMTLPAEPGPHWVWVGDLLLKRSALLDADSGHFLGMLSAGLGSIAPEFSRERHEIYLVETYYSRGTRGERTDVVTVYDAVSLFPVGEIAIPPKRAEHLSGVASSALSDDGRFLAVFNMTPATSLSIVDLKERRFVGEIETPGCSLVYAAGERRFLTLCGNGAALTVTLDESGREEGKLRSEPFFDPEADPVTEKAVRYRNEWLFVSFEGLVHPVDVSGGALRFGEAWSLLAEADRSGGWRIGGSQHLAVHQATGRFYSLVHQGGVDTHKQGGTQVWVYDLATRKRVQRFDVRNPVGVFLRERLELDEGALSARLAGWLFQRVLPNPGADRILVTQDADPVLFSASSFPSTLSAYDARTGEFLRDFEEVGAVGSVLRAP